MRNAQPRSSVAWAGTAVFVLVFVATAAFAEPPPPSPFIEHLEPQAVARGQKLRVALVGSQLDRATGLWTSLPPGKLTVVSVVQSTSERTELELETAADCPVGLYGLRLATQDGLSNLRLFAVDTLSAQAVDQGGDASATPSRRTPVTQFPVSLAGSLRRGSVDRIPIQVRAGERLSFEVIASRFGDDSDPLVVIRSPEGRRLVEQDNSPGLFFDSRFEYRFDEAGVYQVEVRDARFQGSPHWQYILRIGDFPAARVTVPSSFAPGTPTSLALPELGGVELPWPSPASVPAGLSYFELRRPMDRAGVWVPLWATQQPLVVEQEPNDQPDQATRVPAVPACLHGVLSSDADRDLFELELKKGERLTIRAETRTLQSAADVELAVWDANGREVQRNDDVSLPGGALDEALLQFNCGQDGKYRVVVRETTRAGGPEFTYRIDVQRATPRVQLLAEVSALTIPRGSFQIVPVTATRTDYSGAIRLRLEGAPAGVTLESDTIEASVNSQVCIVRAAADAPLGVHSFRLVGQMVAEAPSSKETTASPSPEKPVAIPVSFQPMVDRQIINVDLIKHGLRDNQRYLPPSTREVGALQITEPSPFELAEATRSLTLPRYQSVDVPLQPVRMPGFSEPITFHAVSTGQLGEESQGRKQVVYRFPISTPEGAPVVGSILSRSQANEGDERVDIVATARVGERRVTLVRSVQLSVKPAFELTLEPTTLMIAPGGSTRVKLMAKRLPSFTGPIEVSTQAQPGVTLPPKLTLEANQESVEFDLQVGAEVKPRRERIRFTATAQVGAFQEEPRPKELDVDIKMPPAPPAGGTK